MFLRFCRLHSGACVCSRIRQSVRNFIAKTLWNSRLAHSGATLPSALPLPGVLLEVRRAESCEELHRRAGRLPNIGIFPFWPQTD